MQDWKNQASGVLETYISSFKGLTEGHLKNFSIKKDHSVRVAENAFWLAESLDMDENDIRMAFMSGIFHDIGRFSQLVEFDTFDDSRSTDHAELTVSILKEEGIPQKLKWDDETTIFQAILFHNKYVLPKKIPEKERFQCQLLRDADKLDILKVLTDYYSCKNPEPNHTLTWELPKGMRVSVPVAKDVLEGKQVSKSDVVSEIDVKIMQLSWVYDLNFKPSFKFIFENRFLEKIYNSLPKNDQVIEIYRKIKVYSENRLNG